MIEKSVLGFAKADFSITLGIHKLHDIIHTLKKNKDMIFISSFLLMTTTLTTDQAMEIGVRVWQNECAGTLDGLTCWNDGEDFPSLGIGHFIWYPVHKSGPFTETFPLLVQFLKEKNVDIPRWITDARGCPWKTRLEFRRALQQHSKQIIDLRRLLQKTIPLQIEFLQLRLDSALPLIMKIVPEEKKNRIHTLFDRVRSHPNGLYALIDYVNFKGYGISPDECYNNLGWGLYQVLDNMSDDPQLDPMTNFVKSAKIILETRVDNSPAKRNEQRFLNGWLNRLDTYLNK